MEFEKRHTIIHIEPGSTAWVLMLFVCGRGVVVFLCDVSCIMMSLTAVMLPFLPLVAVALFLFVTLQRACIQCFDLSKIFVRIKMVVNDI